MAVSRVRVISTIDSEESLAFRDLYSVLSSDFINFRFYLFEN